MQYLSKKIQMEKNATYMCRRLKTYIIVIKEARYTVLFRSKTTRQF